MGWVKKRFKELALYDRNGLSKLWNSFRDAAGLAIIEFGEGMASTPFEDPVSVGDCTAKGTYCVRVSRGNKSIEVYLNRRASRLERRSEEGNPMPVCGFRANAELTALEFHSLDEEFVGVPDLAEDDAAREMTISAEQACEMALREFLFDPPPRPFQL